MITDDPKKFLEVCDDWEHGKREVVITWKLWMMVLWIQFMVLVFGSIFWWRYGGKAGQKRREQKGREGMAFSARQKGEGAAPWR